MRLNLSPSVIATGNAWPVFQTYMAQLELETREYIADAQEGNASIDAYDPERQYRNGWGDARLLQAFVQAVGEHWVLKAGLMRSNWGLGLLSNDNSEPEAGAFESPFGSARYVDQYMRAQLVSFPLAKKKRGLDSYHPLTLALAGDATVQDATSDWFDGDRTYTGIGAVLVEFPTVKAGVYVAHRIQEHALGGRTQVTAVDVVADLRFRLGKTHLRFMSEAALIVGETDYAQSVFNDGTYDVFGHGGVARFAVKHGMFEGVFEAGWASGDDNPYDDTVRSFSFSSGYRVGVLMFGEALRTAATVSALNISDPELRDEVPRALDRVTHRGVVRDAVFLNPRVAVRPVDELCLMAGFLYGRSLGAYTDPFWTSLEGGTSAGPNGALRQTELGVELDVAIQYDFSIAHVNLGLRGEFAYFAPGSVFDLPSGESAADVFGFGLHLEARL